MTTRTTDIQRLLELSDFAVRALSFADIRVTKLQAELKNAAPGLPLTTTTTLSETEFERQHSLLIYDIGYRISAEDRQKRQAWSISFTLSLSFRTIKEVPDEAVEAFGAYGVVEIAHPYARELVHQMTARMRVPNFILEVLPTPRD